MLHGGEPDGYSDLAMVCFDFQKASPADSGRNLPAVVDHVVWALQAETKVEEVQNALQFLTGDGNNCLQGHNCI